MYNREQSKPVFAKNVSSVTLIPEKQRKGQWTFFLEFGIILRRCGHHLFFASENLLEIEPGMTPIDREVAWIAVENGHADPHEIQTLLWKYRETGRSEELHEFLVEQNLILPYEAVQIREEAESRASQREWRLQQARKIYVRLKEINDREPR